MKKEIFIYCFYKKRERRKSPERMETVNLTRKRLINIKNSTKIRSLSKY